MNFKGIVQKTVNAKIKAGLKSTIIIWNSDICYSQSYCFLNNISSKIQTQKTIAKDFFYPKKSKTKNLKSAFLYDNIVEQAKKK